MAPDLVQRLIEMGAAISRIETTLGHNGASMDRLTASVRELADAGIVTKQDIVDLEETVAHNGARLDRIEALPWRAARWAAGGAGSVQKFGASRRLMRASHRSAWRFGVR